jgi:hypothetical protein
MTTPARRPPARNPLNRQSQAILATLYPGQIPAVVVQRALQRMAAADRRRARKVGREAGA